MGSKKNFNKFTYGVGLKVEASTFKQVRDDIKLNLETLKKLVKSYEKRLELKPDADLSDLFEQMEEVKSITDGINKSDNSFAGFVDKGVLNRISELENGMMNLVSTSKQATANLNEMRAEFSAMVGSLKEIAKVTIPGTYQYEYDGSRNQNANIQQTKDKIEDLNSLEDEVYKIVDNINKAVDKASSNINIEKIKGNLGNLINEFYASIDLNNASILRPINEITELGAQIEIALQSLSSDEAAKYNVVDNSIISYLDDLNDNVEDKRNQLKKLLDGLNEEQKTYEAKVKSQNQSKKNGAIQSDAIIEATVKPKITSSEWVSEINKVIGDIEGKIQPITLTPTFLKKSKNVTKAIDDATAEIGHTIDIKLEVKNNVETFKDSIAAADKAVQEAKENFAKLHQIPVTLKMANEADILSKVDTLRDAISDKLKDIEINLVAGGVVVASDSTTDGSKKKSKNTTESTKKDSTNNLDKVAKDAEKAKESIKECEKALRSLEDVDHWRSEYMYAPTKGLKKALHTDTLEEASKNAKSLIDNYYKLEDQIKELGKTDDGLASEEYKRLNEQLEEAKKNMVAIYKAQRKYYQDVQEQAQLIQTRQKQVEQKPKEIIDPKSQSKIDAISDNIVNYNEKRAKHQVALNDLTENGIHSEYLSQPTKEIKDFFGTKTQAEASTKVKELINRYDELIKKKNEFNEIDIDSNEYKNLNKELEETKLYLDFVFEAQKKHYESEIKSVDGNIQYEENKIQELRNNTIDIDTQESMSKIDELDKSIDKLESKLKILDGENYLAVGETKLGNISKRKYNGKIANIDELLNINKNTTADKVLDGSTKVLKRIHEDQIKYCNEEIAKLTKQKEQEEEILKYKKQQNKEDKKSVEKPKSTTPKESGGSKVTQTEGSPTKPQLQSGKMDVDKDLTTVKLDDSVLSDLAKDTTVGQIDKKVGEIVSKLNGGLTVKGSDIKITADKVQVSGNVEQVKSDNKKNKKKDNVVKTDSSVQETKDEIKATQQHTEAVQAETAAIKQQEVAIESKTEAVNEQKIAVENLSNSEAELNSEEKISTEDVYKKALKYQDSSDWNVYDNDSVKSAKLLMMQSEDENFLSYLDQRAKEIQNNLKPIQTIVNEISKNSNIKEEFPKGGRDEEGYVKTAKEYQRIDTRLGELLNTYDLTNDEIKEYITLQLKASKMLDQAAKGAGGVRHTSARDRYELDEWIENSFAGDLGLDYYPGMFGNIHDSFYREYGIRDENTGKRKNIKDIIADVFGYSGHKFKDSYGMNQDEKELKQIKDILKYVPDIDKLDFSDAIKESQEEIEKYTKWNEEYPTDFYNTRIEEEKERLNVLIAAQERLNELRQIGQRSTSEISPNQAVIAENTQEAIAAEQKYEAAVEESTNAIKEKEVAQEQLNADVEKLNSEIKENKISQHDGIKYTSDTGLKDEVNITASEVDVNAKTVDANDIMDNPVYKELSNIVKEREKELPNYKQTRTSINVNPEDNTIKSATLSFKSKDNKSGYIERYELSDISDDEGNVVDQKFTKAHAQYIDNFENYLKTLKEQNNLIGKYDNVIAKFKESLDPNASKTLAGTDFEKELNLRISEIQKVIDPLLSFDKNGERILFSQDELLEKKRIANSLILDTNQFIKRSKNQEYPAEVFDTKNVGDQVKKYESQLDAFIEQTKRAGLYTGKFKEQLEALKTELGSVKVGSELKEYQANLAVAKGDYSSLRSYGKLYEDAGNSFYKQEKLKSQIASDSVGENTKAILRKELELEEQIYNLTVDQLQANQKLYEEEVLKEKVVNSILKAEQEIAKAEAKQTDKDISKQNAKIDSIVDKAQDKYNKMSYARSDESILPQISGDALKKFEQYNMLLDELKKKQQAIANDPSLMDDEKYVADFNNLLIQMDKVEQEFNGLIKSSEKFYANIKKDSDVKILGDGFESNNLTALHTEMREFANQVGNGKAELIKFNDAERSATFLIQSGKNEMQQLKVAYDAATNSLGRYVVETRNVESSSQKFFNNIKRGFAHVTQYLASFGGVYEIFAEIRRGLTYVRDIDMALTELKKVTNETDETYRSFLQTMSNVGGAIGATTADLTNSAADWARLGYSIQEAGELAKNTSILMNVSEFETVEEATEAMVSTLQAFNYEAIDSLQIVDKLNIVGKFIARR